jgi:hypothetical protein
MRLIRQICQRRFQTILHRAQRCCPRRSRSGSKKRPLLQFRRFSATEFDGVWPWNFAPESRLGLACGSRMHWHRPFGTMITAAETDACSNRMRQARWRARWQSRSQVPGPSVRRNLQHWEKEHRTIIPERLVGYGHAGARQDVGRLSSFCSLSTMTADRPTMPSMARRLPAWNAQCSPARPISSRS